jgi:hypothetical protein
MRNLALVPLCVLLSGCSVVNNCGEFPGDPGWKAFEPDVDLEQELLGLTLQARQQHRANRLSNRLFRYRSGRANFMLCIPPEEYHLTRLGGGCFSGAYKFSEVAGTLVLVDKVGIVCT